MKSWSEKVFQIAEKYGAKFGKKSIIYQYFSYMVYKFVQIDSVCGHLPPDLDAEFTQNLQKSRIPCIYLIGGVQFKYQPVYSGRSLEEDLWIWMERSDAIPVTFSRTGEITDMKKKKIANLSRLLAISHWLLQLDSSQTLFNSSFRLAMLESLEFGWKSAMLIKVMLIGKTWENSWKYC